MSAAFIAFGYIALCASMGAHGIIAALVHFAVLACCVLPTTNRKDRHAEQEV